MKLFRIAALLALAALPLLLLKKRKNTTAVMVETDDIFDADLRGD